MRMSKDCRRPGSTTRRFFIRKRRRCRGCKIASGRCSDRRAYGRPAVALVRTVASTMNDHNKQRRSIRLKNYDYRQAGAYFVTIVAQDRKCLFGDVVDGTMQLNAAGQMIQSVWDALSAKYPSVETDLSVVMPNHFHGVVVLVGAGPPACPEFGGQPMGGAPTNNSANPNDVAR